MPARPRVTYISVPELSKQLGMRTSRLYYYLDRMKVRTEAMGEASNSVRFVRRSDVTNIVSALNAYRSRRAAALTTEQVAERLDILPSTVRTLVTQKRLKATRSGRFLAFEPSDVDEYAHSRRPRIPRVA